jgi:hypothetical protein
MFEFTFCMAYGVVLVGENFFFFFLNKINKEVIEISLKVEAALGI